MHCLKEIHAVCSNYISLYEVKETYDFKDNFSN